MNGIKQFAVLNCSRVGSSKSVYSQARYILILWNLTRQPLNELQIIVW